MQRGLAEGMAFPAASKELPNAARILVSRKINVVPILEKQRP